MRRTLETLLDSPSTIWLASGITLVLGLCFVFVWAPHPWGWQGIDQYHELALALARGEPFGTTDVPWGYAYFVASLYALFGERAWIPVTIQVIANATVPLMLYRLVVPLAGTRIAVLAALIAGVFSFNTVYASTQASDSLCTILFLASLLAFARGVRLRSLAMFALSGLLSGLVPQFRPNMLLLPLAMAGAYLLLPSRAWRKGLHVALFLAVFASALAPWVVRNHRLTGLFLPSSTHGGVQLWYGSLQIGPYLESRAYNPRSVFESPSFDYTSLAGQSLVITAEPRTCVSWSDATVDLIYWTDRDEQHRRLRPRETGGAPLVFDVPGQPAPTALYYYFEARWPASHASPAVIQASPPAGDVDPRVYFVSEDHLGDLDRHGDLLDVFDLVRLMRHLAWNEAVTFRERLDLERDGRAGPGDLARATVLLLGDGATRERVWPPTPLDVEADAVTLQLADGSTLSVPRHFSGRVTDLRVRGRLASALVTAHRTFSSLTAGKVDVPDPCRLTGEVTVNEVFYRKEVHMMQRYLALAFDNISREPLAFASASMYRVIRLFLLTGSDDVRTAQQFDGSGSVYAAGLVLSTVFFVAFLAGVVIAWRRRSPLLFFLLPIVYVPVTICFVLTNMRYTITVQPLMFAFVAVAIVAMLGLDSRSRDVRATEAQRH